MSLDSDYVWLYYDCWKYIPLDLVFTNINSINGGLNMLNCLEFQIQCSGTGTSNYDVQKNRGMRNS